MIKSHRKYSVSIFQCSSGFTVDDFVGFVDFAVIKDSKNVLSWPVNVASKQKIGKAVQVVVLVQLVFVTL